MKIHFDTPAEEARIEIIPLIDVIFCILTFFLLGALQLTRQQAINIDLPKASSAAPQMREMLVVSLDDFGQVYIEQQQLSAKDQFTQAIKNYSATNPNGLVVLYASRSASYNQVVEVLDLLREAGGEQVRVALATLPGSSDPSAGAPAIPSVPGASGVTPYPGATPIEPYNPYGLPNPTNPYNPTQPQLPGTPQLPGQSGVPTPPPGLPTVPSPGGSAVPGTSDSTPKR